MPRDAIALGSAEFWRRFAGAHHAASAQLLDAPHRGSVKLSAAHAGLLVDGIGLLLGHLEGERAERGEHGERGDVNARG